MFFLLLAGGWVAILATSGQQSPTITRSSSAVPSLSPEELRDAEFAAMLVKDGVPFKDHEDAWVIGLTVCSYLGQRDTNIGTAIVGLVQWRPGSVTPEQAGAAVADAVLVYCPEYKP